MDIQTDMAGFIPLTADAGRKDNKHIPITKPHSVTLQQNKKGTLSWVSNYIFSNIINDHE